MFLVAPVDNNRWAYTMHGLEKPMDHVSGNVMLAILFTLNELRILFIIRYICTMYHTWEIFMILFHLLSQYQAKIVSKILAIRLFDYV